MTPSKTVDFYTVEYNGKNIEMSVDMINAKLSSFNEDLDKVEASLDDIATKEASLEALKASYTASKTKENSLAVIRAINDISKKGMFEKKKELLEVEIQKLGDILLSIEG